MDRHVKRLDMTLCPDAKRKVADVLQLSVVKEEVQPELQERSLNPDQEDPEVPRIKEEQEEFWTTKETDIIKFRFSPVKSEEDEDVHQPSVVKEESPPEQQVLSPILIHKDPEAHNVKEEKDELWTNQELQGMMQQRPSSDVQHRMVVKEEVPPDQEEEADIIKFTFNPVFVKSEYDEEKALSQQLHQIQTEENREKLDGEDNGGQSYLVMETSHTGEKPFSCAVCLKCFRHKNDVRRHMATHTGEKPFSCSECGSRFARKSHLVSHMISHTGEKPFSCSTCQKCFRYKNDVRRHMATHTGEKPFHCSVCNSKFARKSHLLSHMICHSGEKPYSCSFCQKGFKRKSNVQRHMMIHTREDNGSNLDPDKHEDSDDWVDNERNAQSSQLYQRQTKENGEEYDGEDSGESKPASGFYPHRQLQSQTDEQTDDSESTEDTDEDLNNRMKHSCNRKHRLVDSSERVAKVSLKTTIVQVINAPRDKTKTKNLTLIDVGCKTKRHHCSECGKAFEKMYFLKRHMRVHTGEKPFFCLVCDKRFTCKSNLLGHMTRHTGEKPFSCSVCQKSFRHKNSVRLHMVSHTGDKPFCCSICGIRFAMKSNLLNHMICHTGEKPFSCSVCQKRFKRKGCMRKHMLSHSENASCVGEIHTTRNLDPGKPERLDIDG